MFLSSQLWNKKEDVGSKVSESGKCCTRTCTSHMASGFENGQVALPFEECGTLWDSKSILPTYGPFSRGRSHIYMYVNSH